MKSYTIFLSKGSNQTHFLPVSKAFLKSPVKLLSSSLIPTRIVTDKIKVEGNFPTHKVNDAKDSSSLEFTAFFPFIELFQLYKCRFLLLSILFFLITKPS